MSYDVDLNFVYAFTPRVIFGVNVLQDLSSHIGELRQNRAVVITDGFIAEKTDLLERVKKSLGRYLAGVFSGVIPDPTAPVVDQGATYARGVGANILISLGGGSAIDTAKGIAVVLTEGGKLLDHEGYHALERPLTPHIAIPTTAGTGSEMTLVTVIKDPARRQKTFIGSYYLHPNLAVLDPTLTVGMPPALTAATGMDAMSHSVEALISTLRQPFSDALALEAIRIISTFLPQCIEKPNDLVARGQMLIAANLAGTAFSNAMASLNHGMAHSIGARYGVHHGTANAILLPHTMRYFMEVSKEQFAQVATAMGLDCSKMSAEKAGNLAADHMEKFVRSIGLTERLRDYKIPEGALPEIADLTMSDGTIVYSPLPVVDPNEVLKVLKKAW